MIPERLKKVPLFASLSKRQLEELGGLSDEVEVAAGTNLAKEGRLAYEFFVIEDGTVEVLHENGAHIADLGAGDFFGEIGLLEHAPRTATVVAKTPVKLIVIASREFATMLADMPEVAQTIKRVAEERLQKT